MLLYLSCGISGPISITLNLDPELPVVGAKNPIGKCPNIDGETPTYLADSEDCGIFYECSAGRAILMECPSDLCFDLRLNVCTFPPKKAMDVRHGKCFNQIL